MTDKKSVIVELRDPLVVKRFEAGPGISYSFEIGEQNGCLVIVKLTETESVISVPDEETVEVVFAAHKWERVYRE